MTQEEYIALLKHDFKNFLWFIWNFLGLPPPTRAQYMIADFLQNPDIRNKIIEAFRGIGKSWITSAYVLWRLFRDHDYKALVVSASKSRSDDFSTFTRRLIKDVPILQYLQAHEGQHDSMVAFDVGPARPAHAPSVKSCGIFGQLTGSRAVEIIADDVEVVNNSATQEMREKLYKACTEFTDIVVPEIGQITYLGTPQTEESIYNKLAEAGFTRFIIPAEYPDAKQSMKYGGALADYIVQDLEKNPSLIGHSTDPARFSDQELMKKKAQKGLSGYMLQYMMDTSLSDLEKYPLRLTDLICMGLDFEKAPISLAWSSDPACQIKILQNIGFTGDHWLRPMFIDKEFVPYEGSVMAIDPAGRGSDELSYAVVNQLHGFLYLMKSGGLRGGYTDENLETLAKIAKRFKVKEIVIESNFGDGMFNKILEPVMARIYPVMMTEVRSNIQKEKRIIDTLEPVMNRHRLVVDLAVISEDFKMSLEDPMYSLFYQLTRITKERGALRHDDRLDALALAVAYWVNAMARDENIAAQDARDRAVEEELRRFMEHVIDKSRCPDYDNGMRWS